MNSLIVRLIATHRMLNREIRRELARRIPDHIRLTQLKKRRLMVKSTASYCRSGLGVA